MFYVELHTHTFPASSDSLLSPELLVAETKARGLDGVVVSNHYDYFQLERQNGSFEDKIHAWTKDITEAKKIGEKCGVHVYAGMEYSVGLLHMGVLGVTEDILRDNPPEPERSLQYLVGWARTCGAVLVNNHPLRKNYIFTRGFGGGYEAWNTKYGHIPEDSKAIVDSTGILDTFYVAGSDAHRAEHLGTSATVFHKAPQNERELANMLRNREFSVVVNINNCKNIKEAQFVN